jgi:hypothetical protein
MGEADDRILETHVKNSEAFMKEAEFADHILQKNRHRSCQPYDWFGPEAERCPPGEGCRCRGCAAGVTHIVDSSFK